MDELDRLFRSVIRSVRDTRPEYLSCPFEVAELLAFVPYRTVREELGVETNDDYAHALTRLLAGERGYLFADDLMQDDLKSELASPNPDLAAYRAYVNARVSLSQEHTRKELETMGPPPAPAEEPTRAADPHVAVAPLAPPVPPVPPRASAPAREPATVAHSAAARPMATAPRPLDASAEAPLRASRPGCRYCGHPLPEARDVHFCPHCGQNLLVRRCAACSAELDPGWKFCVACGRAATL